MASLRARLVGPAQRWRAYLLVRLRVLVASVLARLVAWALTAARAIDFPALCRRVVGQT